MPPPPIRARRPTLLVVGCGDIGLRVARLVAARWRVLGLSHTAERLAVLRSAGVVPIAGDLDRADSLARLAGLADAVLHLAPPAPSGVRDARTANLLGALGRDRRIARLVYGSTTGVYGDTGGALVDETRAPRPATDRARRRVDAERQVRAFGRRHGVRTTILRIPGIYAFDRPGGDPRERVRRGEPVLVASDDVITNHVHADDLARACVAALVRGPAPRVVNVVDDSALAMGDHYDRVADRFGLPRPPRLTRAEAATVLSPMQMSFLAESRRLANARLKRELRVALRYPSVDDGLAPRRIVR